MTATSERTRAGTGLGKPPGGSDRSLPVQGPVWLVLHEPDDASGPALARSLQRQLLHQSTITEHRFHADRIPQVLALSTWALRLRTAWSLGIEGTRTRWRLKLGDGRVLDEQVVGGVLNRLHPVHHCAPGAESAYQAAEWSAMLLAWLHALRCPVINRPRAANPYPTLHDRAWWQQQARQAGLDCWPGPPHATPPGPGRSDWLVVADHLAPARDNHEQANGLSHQTRTALVRLARQGGCDLIKVDGIRDTNGDWYFLGANPMPAEASFGAAGTQALTLAMSRAPSAPTASAPDWRGPRPSPRQSRLVAVLGQATEGPCHLLLSALKRQGTPCVLLDQRQLVPPDPDAFRHLIDSGGHRADWARLHGLYLRPGDTRRLGLEVDRQRAAETATQAWSDYAEWAPLIVVNRLSAMLSNSSKPLQAQVLASAGFAIPPMLMTNDPNAVGTFEAEHGPLIFKSASGVRSIVSQLDAVARRRLQHVTHAPTLFQKRLRGTNVRVHVVGEAVFATEIDSGVLDYRYASRQHQTTTLRATRLPLELEGRCRMATEQLGLRFAGLDLMLADDGQVYCFEVNPSPGYSWYEDATGQDISGQLARLLSGTSD